MKVCTKCTEEKPLDQFYARKGATDGKMSSCKLCKKEALYLWRKQNADKFKSYMREYQQGELSRERVKAYRKRPEVIEAERRRDRARGATESRKQYCRDLEKGPVVAAYRREYRRRDYVKKKSKELASRPENRRKVAAAAREKRRTDPFTNVNARMSNAIGQAIRKNHKSWRSLVGYSCLELMAHLEKQFLKGMSWENFGKWHIDHIVPKSSFTYEKSDDAEFLECWSLSNLRPIWAKENLSKGAKHIFLL